MIGPMKAQCQFQSVICCGVSNDLEEIQTLAVGLDARETDL